MGLFRGLQREQNIKAQPVKQPNGRATISFDVGIGPYLYFGLALLLIALLVLTGTLATWIVPQWEQNDLHTNLNRAVFLGWIIVFLTYSGVFLVIAGLSDRNRKVLLDQTKLVLEPLFWREKIIIGYEQIGQVIWSYPRRSSLRMKPNGVEIHYYLLNSRQQIDDSKLYKLGISGVENDTELLEELQKRSTGPKPVGLIPLLPNFRERMLKWLIILSLFYGPILLMLLIRLLLPF